jgi:hypothetical protein
MVKTANSSAMGVGKSRKASELRRKLLGGPSALLVDPLGFDAGDSNLYRYVNNGPTLAIDASGNYEEDVHFYMTYYIARSIGLNRFKVTIPYAYKSPNSYKTIVSRSRVSESYVIAWADQFTDLYDYSKPATSIGDISSQALRRGYQDILRRFHFRHEKGKNVEAGSKVASGPLDEALADAKKTGEGNSFLIGIGLHAYQDSWSHAGYDSVLGHASADLGGHAPDYPWVDVEKAMEMAKGTYDKLHGGRSRHPPLRAGVLLP